MGKQLVGKEFTTRDFYTVAVLLFRGFEYREVTRHGDKGQIKQFHFEDSDELQDTITKFHLGKLEGNIRDFKNCIETVKDIIHA